MAQDISNHLLSYADYAAIDDGRRYEVLDGELTLMTPSPRLAHQRAVLAIGRLLDDYARASAAGQAIIAPFDVVLRAERPAVIFQPDVLFVTASRSAIVGSDNVRGAPDLVVEVLSPSSARLDAVTKRRAYAAFGVLEYWVVSLDEEQIKCHTLNDGSQYGKPTLFEPGDRLTTPLLPGFELDVGELFARAAEA